ncbi:MAG: UDP-glucose 4-epimerase GalE [Humidesulfovibrio sp.]|uniref:UDP-glucose 4-epimerase GalE n=1 Tax=Humidesulfovibrio sp. TaxID=2910988 RepID=UPI0027363458|nr:UDP-glucose 4-epimerase GalE [Humidesulfovibrio sp.]MDP2847152.1 UDP-glucose 4-epimerase GalE [Humidesulfovibrio sp.]
MGQILVTGGAGYIGAHTAKRLNSAGLETTVLDNLATGHRDFARWGAFIQGDVCDPVTLDRLFSSRNIDTVVHFAAASQVSESVRKPLLYYQNNVAGTIALLAAMRRHDVKNLVFSSSCAVYGPPFDVPLSEAHPCGPISPYAKSKLMIEGIMQDLAQAGDLNYVALRYFNAAGADPEAEVGERHNPETHLIPLVLQVALGQREHLDIFGDDYPTPDGTAIRDYIHVQDLADAHIAALRHLQNGGASGPINLGNGQGHSVREIVEAAREVTGRDIRVRQAPRRPGDSPRLVGDASKAREVLGWRPQFSDIREIIATAWAWHQQETRITPQR